MTSVKGPLAVTSGPRWRMNRAVTRASEGLEGSDFDLFEVEAVPPGARREPGRVVAPDEVEAGPGAAAVHEGGGALASVIRQKPVQVSPVPIRGRAVQLRGDQRRQRGRVGAWRRCRCQAGPSHGRPRERVATRSKEVRMKMSVEMVLEGGRFAPRCKIRRAGL